MNTAEQLKKIRLSLCLNQREFAEALGITISSISYYEKGNRKPSFCTMRKIISLTKKNGIKLKLEDIRDEL